MADSIIDGTNIDLSVLSYSSIKAHASGGKVVNLYNRHFRESLTLSTPLMLTWGAQEGKDTAGNPTGKWTLALQFPSSDYTTPEQEAFLSSMRQLETRIKADAMTYSREWFGKVITSSEVMDEKFNVMLRHPKVKNSVEPDLSKPPTLTVKIPCWNGVWKPEIYDEDGEPLFVSGKVNTHSNPLEYLRPKTHVMCLIQCGGLWFVNGKVSITWNLKQAVVQKPKQTIEEGHCFIRMRATDRERLRTLPTPEDVDPDGAVVVQSTTIVEDSDDEHEERKIEIVTPTPVQTPAPAPAPTPAPAPAPTIVTETTSSTHTTEPDTTTTTASSAPKKKIVRKKTTTEA